MTRTTAMLAGLALSLTFTCVGEASLTEVSTVIEQFVQKRFPNARQHFWVINQTTVEEDEVTIDVKTVVTMPPQDVPVEERFLLLIVKGELAAAQSIPLEGDPDCRREEA